MYLIFCLQYTYSQSTQSIPQALEAIRWSALPFKNQEIIEQIYTQNNLQYLWLKSDSENITAFYEQLAKAKYLGLDSAQYSYHKVLPHKKLSSTGSDSALQDISITYYFIRFLKDLMAGNHEEKWLQVASNQTANNYLYNILQKGIIPKNIVQAWMPAEPADSLYQSVKQMLKQYLDTLSTGHFTEIPVRSSMIKRENKALINRLAQLGWGNTKKVLISDSSIKRNIQLAQKQFGLLQDGKIRTTLLNELNTPMRIRAQSLAKTLNIFRWIGSMEKEVVTVVVNIPSATLLAFDRKQVVLSSRIIVGKRSTPTPTLISNINEVILYPYWHVPHSIAIHEVLPAVKRNAQYLLDNHFEVLDNNGRIVSPKSIQWSLIHPANLTYTFRQLTGCENALGLIKLNFKSHFSVYLHDTPNKYLFQFNKRYFSHGCIRVEKIKEIAAYLLPKTRDSLEKVIVQGCLQHEEPKTIPIEKKAMVMVIYQTAWFDDKLQFHFYEDIYHQNQLNKSH